MIGSNPGGSDGARVSGYTCFWCWIAASASTDVLAMNGFCPVAASYSTTPSENRSVCASSGSFRACSGYMYTVVPGITFISVIASEGR